MDGITRIGRGHHLVEPAASYVAMFDCPEIGLWLGRRLSALWSTVMA